jgi:hypothetical protein
MGAKDHGMEEGSKASVNFNEYEAAQGHCSDGLLKYHYENKGVVSFNYDF